MNQIILQAGKRAAALGRCAGAIVVMVMAGGAGSLVAQPSDPFANWLSGADGFTQAMTEHNNTDRPLAVYFYTDWCPYCKRLNTDILASDEAQAYLKNVIAVRINPERGSREKALANTYGVSGYPSFFIMAPGSDKPQRVHPFHQGIEMTPTEFFQACGAAGRKPRSTQARPRSAVRKKTPPAPRSDSASSTARPPYHAAHPVTLYLRNGRLINGDLVSETPQALTLRWDYGEMVFERGEIERLVDETTDKLDETPMDAQPSSAQ